MIACDLKVALSLKVGYLLVNANFSRTHEALGSPIPQTDTKVKFLLAFLAACTTGPPAVCNQELAKPRKALICVMSSLFLYCAVHDLSLLFRVGQPRVVMLFRNELRMPFNFQ